MITYVVLANFATKGRKDVKRTTKRADEFRKLAKKFDVTLKEIFWTHGQYDVVVVAEAPDEFSATALNLSLIDLGNVRTQTLRAFTAAEMDKIIAKT